jgi:transposase
MDKVLIERMQSQFNSLIRTIPESKVEFWFAREIQSHLGYKRWENFIKVIEKAIESCKNANSEPSDHFRGVTKLINEPLKSLKTRKKNNRYILNIILVIFVPLVVKKDLYEA